MGRPKIETSVLMIIGMIFIFHLPTSTLFELKSILLYVSAPYAPRLGLSLELLTMTLCVATPMVIP